MPDPRHGRAAGNPLLPRDVIAGQKFDKERASRDLLDTLTNAPGRVSAVGDDLGQLGVFARVEGDDAVAGGSLEYRVQHGVVLANAGGRQPVRGGGGDPALHVGGQATYLYASTHHSSPAERWCGSTVATCRR